MLRKLEKYEIEEEIGHGGMATVYRAHDTDLDRKVALKVMHPHLRGAEEARRRFQREARSVARLHHPRVLEIYDFSNEGSEEAFIAAELLTGPTLKQWRETRREVPAEIAACVVIEVAKALEAAHAAGIVHRDVKPENVLLHEDRTLKLTDFGIADMVDAASMTATGQILGSPGHMAPEQIEGRPTDTRTDLFSLGTVLYYLATGRLPFTGRNPHQILKRIVDCDYADPLRVNPTIGGRLRGIIVKALAHDLEDRHQTAKELREDLEAFVAEVGIDDPPKTLERFLQDPDATTRALTSTTVDRLIAHGARASDAGDVPTALDYYNRVLALDEGNERVLKLIERVGLDLRRRSLLMAGAGLMAFGLAAGALAWVAWPDPQDITARDLRIGAESVLDAAVEADGGTEPDAALASTPPTGDAGLPRSPDSGATAEVSADAGRRTSPPVRDTTPRVQPPRVVAVRLSSLIQSMTVSIDGNPAVEFTRLGTLQLSPGRHSIVLTPARGVLDRYRLTTLSVTVPASEREVTIPVALDLQPAGVYVRCNVAGAQVTLRDGSARGPANDLFYVPMSDADRRNVEVRVSAPGYVTQTSWVNLRSGQNYESTVTLVPDAPAPEISPDEGAAPE